MARILLSLQLNMLLILLSMSSALLSLSDAARCGTFTQGSPCCDGCLDVTYSSCLLLRVSGRAESTPLSNPADKTGLRGVTEESSCGSCGSAAQRSSRNGIDTQSAATQPPNSPAGEEELAILFEEKESRSDISGYSLASSLGAGSIGHLRREKSMVVNSGDELTSKDDYLRILQRVDLLRRLNVPFLGIWQITDEEEESCRRMDFVLTTLLEARMDGELQTLEGTESVSQFQEVNYSPNLEDLQTDASSQEMREGNDCRMVSSSTSRALLADISPPGIWTDTQANGSQMQKRRLLADISPPGMWSDDSTSDDMEDRSSSQKRRL